MSRRKRNRKPKTPPGKTRYVSLMRKGEELQVGEASQTFDRRVLVAVEASPATPIRKRQGLTSPGEPA